jgi:hypothetical protein
LDSGQPRGAVGFTFAASDRIGPARLFDGFTRQNVELGGSVLLDLSPWLFGSANRSRFAGHLRRSAKTSCTKTEAGRPMGAGHRLKNKK